MENIIITIGREYGSGGKYIGEKVAEKLNIPFYNDEIIEKAAEISNCNYSKISAYDETKKGNFIQSFNIVNPEEMFEYEKYHVLMNNTIKKLAETSSCVIIGRNSNNVLKNHKNTINIFIYSNNEEFKLERKMHLANLTRKEAEKIMKKVDKKRKEYYEYVNKNHKWGSKEEYDFLIDSNTLGIEKTIDLIINIYNDYKEKLKNN